MVRLTLFSFQRSTVLPRSNFYIIPNLRFGVNTFLKKVSKYFLLDVIECFATTSLVYQVVRYLSTTFFLIFQVFLSLKCYFIFALLSLFLMTTSLFYQVSHCLSTTISLIVKVFFKPGLLCYIYRLACFISALRQDIIYQDYRLRSTKICTFFKVFFVPDCFITFVLYCSLLSKKPALFPLFLNFW